MKKVFVYLMVLIMAFTLVACGQVNLSSGNSEAKSSASSGMQKIKDSGKLVIGTSAAYPPYEFHKEVNGKDTIVGFDIDIAKEIAKDLGVELEIKDMEFKGLLAALEAGKIDIVIAGMTPTEERKQSVDFSKVYYVATQGVVVQTDKADLFKTADDLKDKVVGVQKGTTQEEIAKQIVSESQIKGLGKVSDVMLQAINGKIDAVIVETPVAKSYVQQNPALAVSEIKLETGDSGSAIAIKKGNEDLVQAIDATLDRLMKDNMIEDFVLKATELVEN
ncbi:transporter substrate-binding domain-containing protein [Brassicibacter mesophilus]|uniref:transporter substrate-binding domain-containing protein n=1 Tax=Brassicibacter mesophilus TaxID=745119 RepID=UPI003D1E026B